MTLQDFLITPVFLLLLLMVALAVRPAATNRFTRRYYLSALLLRFGGAIALGMIYQFYYGGGDTFNYFTHGSSWIWQAFMDSPGLGLKLLLTSGGEHFNETFAYSSRIWYYRDPNSYTIVRLAAFFDVFTYHTYTATALFFAAFSFSGSWAMFTAVVRKYPQRSRWLAFVILYVPSVVFWGSGILKDTITLGALGWLTWAMIHLVDFGRRSPKYWIAAVLAAYIIYAIKIYILVCYVPLVFVWLYWKYQIQIRNSVIRVLVAPVLFAAFASVGYLSLQQVTSETNKYSLDAIAQQAAITSYDIRYGWGARTGGDGGYDLGVLDGTWQSMIRLMPQAINVSLFRPYLWEARNPLMLLSALESLAVLLLTLRVVFTKGAVKRVFSDPFLVFCVLFAVLFAFAVGISTYNFGTLMRYKIPLVPFYGVALVIGLSSPLRVLQKAK